MQPREAHRPVIDSAYFFLHSFSPIRPPTRIHFNMKISRSSRRWRCTQESGINDSVRASGTKEASATCMPRRRYILLAWFWTPAAAGAAPIGNCRFDLK